MVKKQPREGLTQSSPVLTSRPDDPEVSIASGSKTMNPTPMEDENQNQEEPNTPGRSFFFLSY